MISLCLALVLFLGYQQKAHAQGGGITDDERTFLTDYMKSVKERMKTALDDISSEEWTKQRPDGGWSPAQIMEHINIGCRAQLAQIKGSLSRESGVKDLSKNDGLLLTLMVDRGQTFPTPLPPKSNGAKSKEELFSLFVELENEWLRMANDSKIEWRNYYGRTPFKIQADTYQLMLLLAGHAMRHTNQMIEVLKINRS